MLKENGIRPAPERPSPWRSFLRSHWGQIAAMDFFTVEVWTPMGLKTFHVLFAIDLRSRRADIAGITTSPNEAFVAQVARNLTVIGEASLRRAISGYVDHYHVERAHQGLENERIDPAQMGEGKVRCDERFGGILKHDCRAA